MAMKELGDAVHAAIKAGQIGRPVFVRCYIGVPEDSQERELFVDCVMTLQSWFGDTPEGMYAVGSFGPGLSLHLVFRNGSSGLICGLKAETRGADLVILGNHGAIYRDALVGGIAPLAQSYPESEQRRTVRNAVELAVSTGKPQTLH
jgi:hypothetical protein